MQEELPSGYFVNIAGDYGKIFINIHHEDGSKDADGVGLGMLHMSRTQIRTGNVWELDNVAAQKGYGPLLYDIAMELVGPDDYIGDDGLMPDMTHVSADARRVWQKYYERSDVEHDALPEEMFDYSDMRNRPDSMRYYYYKINTPVIDHLKSLGQIRSDDFTFLEESNEILQEAHFGKFNMNVFKKFSEDYDAVKKMHDYAGQHLQVLGEGSSRTAFALSTSKVLKIINISKRAEAKGKAQNEAEVDVWTNPSTKMIAAKIFDFDGKRYDWLVMETAQQINNRMFQKILDIPFGIDYSEMIEVMVGKKSIRDIISDLEWRDNFSNETEGIIRKYIENPPPYMSALLALIKNSNLTLGDINAEHFGKTADGRIVLFDYGCTNEVWLSHYKNEFNFQLDLADEADKRNDRWGL